MDKFGRRGGLDDVVGYAKRPDAFSLRFIIQVDQEKQGCGHGQAGKGMIGHDDAGMMAFQQHGQAFMAGGCGHLESRLREDIGHGGQAPAVRIRHDGRAW